VVRAVKARSRYSGRLIHVVKNDNMIVASISGGRCFSGRHQDTQTRDRFSGSFEEIEGGIAMKAEKLELVRGSGNVFRDLSRENADVEQLKALLAAEIIKALDRDKLTVRAAHGRTGFAAADFSRIRNADLARFTADRLVSILNRLGSRVEVKIRVRRLETPSVRDELRA
jgi:predicted XRE-type DNA-binding protein